MSKTRILAATVAAALSSGLFAAGAMPLFAAEAKPMATEAPAAKKAEDAKARDDLIKVSEDAASSIRDLHSARLAIFDGEPERAQTYTDAAATRIAATVKEEDKYALDIKAEKADDRYVPFDANLMVTDTYVPSEENAKHVAKANEHLKKGETKKAIEALKLGNIDVAVATSLFPVNFAKEHIDEAAKLIGEGKYYEANLALKAVDDSIVTDTFAIDAVPKANTKK
ncbi:MAG: YfdX family protein [Bdellovibrio bacteriovorus]